MMTLFNYFACSSKNNFVAFTFENTNQLSVNTNQNLPPFMQIKNDDALSILMSHSPQHMTTETQNNINWKTTTEGGK